MEFTSHRKLTLAALGHVVVFEKGATHYVPPALRQLALEQGLEPANGAALERGPAKQEDGARLETIKTAMKLIAERNNPDDFTAGGLPKVRAIEALADGAKPADAKEHQALWAEVAASV